MESNKKMLFLCLSLFMAFITFSMAQNSESNKSSLVLASKRTYRPDPLSGFHKYTGGWNIRNSHYLASVSFTGVPFFVAGLVWFVVMGIGLVLGMCFCCCKYDSERKKSNNGFVTFLLVILTLATIGGSALIYVGGELANTELGKVVAFVMEKADFTEENIQDVIGYLQQAKNVEIMNARLPAAQIQNANDIIGILKNARSTLDVQTNKNAARIHRALEFLRWVFIGVAVAMTAIVLLGLVFSITRMRILTYILLILAWFLVTFSFMMGGVSILAYNVVADGCVAMDQWVRHPQAHTALDDILPCVDRETALISIKQSNIVTTGMVSTVNKFIDNVANNDIHKVMKYNQSGPLVPELCNPYNNEACSKSKVTVKTAPKMWESNVCEVSSRGLCKTKGRLTPHIYNDMSNVAHVSYGLYHYTPFFVNLRDCTLVRDAFDTLHSDYCPGITQHLKWTFIGLVIASVAVSLSVVFWLLSRC